MLVKDMLRIAHSINDRVFTTSPFANIESVSKTLKNKGVGALPVISNGKLVGIISERDIITKVVATGSNPSHTLVTDTMTPNPTFVTPKDNLEHCLDLMEEGRFRHLPVIDDGKLTGMISVRDILVALLREKADLLNHFESFLYSNR